MSMSPAPPLIKRILLGVALSFALGAASPAAADLFGAIDQALRRAELFQGVEVSGQNTFTFQGEAIQGSRATYEGQRWDTGNFLRQSSLHIQGPIWREFGFQLDLSASGWGPDYTRWVVGYAGQDTALYYGDLNVGLMGNEFASFSKSLQGWQLDQRLPGDGLLRAFFSEEKGFTRNESFAGNNTPGPYFLTYTPIIDGSLRVKVDEEQMELGKHYRVDYQTGELWFEPVNAPPLSISSTSTISVSYQSSGYYTSAGTLSGVRAEMPLAGRRGTVGLTLLRQDRPQAGQGDTAGYQEDFYQGSGTTGPFDTNFRPILADGASVVYRGETITLEQALVVLVDSVPQMEGVDFDSYRQIGRVIFRRAVPPTALVRIQYYYSLGQRETVADLDIAGLDLSYRLSPELSLTTHFARSSGGRSLAEGNALTALLSYSRPRLQVSTEWRQMDPSFSYMDTVGFYRQESGMRARFDWRPTDYLSVYDTFSRMRSSTGLSFGYSGYEGGSYFGGTGSSLGPLQSTESSLSVTTERNAFGIRLDHPRWPALSFSRDTMSNSGGAQAGSSYTNDRLELRHQFSRQLQFSAAWQGNRQEYNQAGTGEGATRPGSRMNQTLFSLSYAPSDQLSFSANLTDSRSAGRAVTGQSQEVNSSAQVMQVGMRWSPSRRLSVNLDHSRSRSDGAVYSGFFGGAPGSYYPPGGGGWPGPIAGSVEAWQEEGEETERARYEDSSNRVSLNYQPWDNLSLSLSLGQRKYLSGGGLGYLADSSQDTANLFLTWRLSDAFSVTTGFGRDTLDFLQAGRGAVSNESLTASVNWQPPAARWGLSLGMQRQTGTSPTYLGFGTRQRYLMVDTDLFDVNATVRYRMNDRSNLYAQLGMSDFASGYSSFTKNLGVLGWEWDLNQTTRLDFGYQFVRNLAGTPTSPLYTGTAIQGQNYLANTFRLQMTTTFSGGTGTGGGFSAPSGYGGGVGAFGGTGLGTFGGYQTGVRGIDFGAPSTTSGWGSSGLGGAFGDGWRDTGTRPRYQGTTQQQEGFSTGLRDFQQEGTETPAAPRLDWGPEGDRPAPGEAGQEEWRWLEGLSRWDLGAREEWW